MAPQNNEQPVLIAALERIEAGIKEEAKFRNQHHLRLSLLEEKNRTSLWARIAPYLLPVVFSAFVTILPLFVIWGGVKATIDNPSTAVERLERTANSGYPEHSKWITAHEATSKLQHAQQSKLNAEQLESRRRMWDQIREHAH